MLQGLDTTILGETKTPERNLLASILFRAFSDLDNANPVIQKDAYNWVFMQYNHCDEKWSFKWVCGWLDLDPEALRQLMLNTSFTQKIQKLKKDRYKRKKT